MASKAIRGPGIRPSDLPTKTVRASDGTEVRLKVVRADSPTLDEDLLAAFRSNVRRIRSEDREAARGAQNTSQG